MFKYLKILLIPFLLIYFTSCESTNDNKTLQDIAIDIIVQYANGSEVEPTIQNYADAGIIGVDESNIKELNIFVLQLEEEDVDSFEKIKAIIDELGISLDTDVFPPIITLKSDNPLTIEKNAPYEKECATAIDDRDGEVPVYILGDVDTTTIGKYIVTYSAVDRAGNMAKLDRVVYVVEATYSLSGVARGIEEPVILQNNGKDDIHINKDGEFGFPTELQDGDSYIISVLKHGERQVCDIQNKRGTIDKKDVDNLILTCQIEESAYRISLVVTGIDPLDLHVINHNNGDDLAIGASGPYLLPTFIPSGSEYDLEVVTSPSMSPVICTIINDLDGGDDTKVKGVIYSTDLNFDIDCSY